MESYGGFTAQAPGNVELFRVRFSSLLQVLNVPPSALQLFGQDALGLLAGKRTCEYVKLTPSRHVEHLSRHLLFN
jgi:hypothetical protein